MKCYTALMENEAVELTQARENIKKALSEIGGERAKKLADDLWTLENEVNSRSCMIGYEDAMTITLPLLPAIKLVKLIEQQVITGKEALAALDAKSSRRRKMREEEPEAKAA